MVTVQGTLGGDQFTLSVDMNLAGGEIHFGPDDAIADATGIFRGQPVRASLFSPNAGPALTFTGTIGSYHVTGKIGAPKYHGDRGTARASFVVSS